MWRAAIVGRLPRRSSHFLQLYIVFRSTVQVIHTLPQHIVYGNTNSKTTVYYVVHGQTAPQLNFTVCKEAILQDRASLGRCNRAEREVRLIIFNSI